MENAASKNMKVFEQYENLERAGMAPSIAQAVRDFVLATLQDMVSLVDWREYKAERASELEKFEANQDRNSDQIRHEITETRQELKSDIEQVRQELKSDIKQVHQELKSDIKQVRQELKSDIKQVHQELKGDIKQVRQELKSDIEHVHHELKSDIEQVHHELKSDIEQTRNGLDQKMSKLQFDLVKWMIGLFFAQAGLNAAIVTGIKLFGH